MTNYFYSIIIPHKNTPKLLQRCLDSIPIREDTEIIIVDDNSDEELVDFNKFPGKDRANTIVIFDKRGNGAGAARNVGLKKAHGKWLIFADSDDFFSEEFSSILDNYKDEEADIIYFCVKSVMSDNINRKSTRTDYLNKKIEDYFNKHDDSDLRCNYVSPWGKLYKKELIDKNGIFFEEIRYSNDVVFSVHAGCKASKILVDKKCLYVVTERKGSLTSQIDRTEKEKNAELEVRAGACYRASLMMVKSGYFFSTMQMTLFLRKMYLQDKKLYIEYLPKLDMIYPTSKEAMCQIAQPFRTLGKIRLYAYTYWCVFRQKTSKIWKKE